MPADSPCLCANLRRVTRAVTAAYDAALRPVDLRITQFSILRILERLGPVGVTRLANEAALDRSTMGRNLDPLERRGLVQLSVNAADQRERVAALTEAGRAALGAALPLWQAAQAHVETALPMAFVADLAGRLARLESP